MTALCDRDAGRAEELARRPAISLAEQVRETVTYLR
jgi:hypothetical protein